MNGESKLSAARLWFNILWSLVILYAFSHAIMAGMPGSRSSISEPPPLPSSNYHRQFCSDRKTIEYGDSNPDTIVIHLHDGCYGDRYLMPKAWKNWQLQLSSNIGDYISLWCTEEANPRPTVIYTGDPTGLTVECPANHHADFSTEGQGIFTLVRTQTNPSVLAEIAQKNFEATYKSSPVAPTEGDHTGFSITLDLCFRADENIRCQGTVANMTDARTKLEFRGGTIVDDEGNTIPFGDVFYVGPQQQRDEDLLPNAPAKYVLTIPDPHRNVKTINIELKTCWYARYVQATQIFSGITVQ